MDFLVFEDILFELQAHFDRACCKQVLQVSKLFVLGNESTGRMVLTTSSKADVKLKVASIFVNQQGQTVADIGWQVTK